jgi:FAD/FMN-containing dehydrogenase
MADWKAELGNLAGSNYVFDDPETLDRYSRDNSFARAMKPQCVVKPTNTDTIQKIVNWAKSNKTPLIPVSSGPPHFHGGTIPGVPGSVVIDLSGMKKIIKVNRRNRLALIEPGVTYGELQPVLAKENLRLSTPLLPRASKSVVASLLEREPRLNCRYQWSSLDPLRCLEIVWGDGNKFYSGGIGSYLSVDKEGDTDFEAQFRQQKWQVDPSGPAQTDFYRFLTGAQGSIGIATWASVKCEVLPEIHKLYFVPGTRLDDLVDFTYKLVRYRYGDELFIVNGANLAYMLGKNSEQIQTLKKQLPPWIVVVGIAGRTELPVERVEFLEKDIAEIAGQFSLKFVPGIPGAEGSKVLETLMGPPREPYWKQGYKGGCQDIFFITTLDKTPDFLKTMYSAAEKLNYPSSDIGVYLQPRHQGANCHCEFNLPYVPGESDKSSIKALFDKASQALFEQGAFFTRPYGIWADMAFKRNDQNTRLLKKIKETFDPEGIMNPKKLCF